MAYYCQEHFQSILIPALLSNAVSVLTNVIITDYITARRKGNKRAIAVTASGKLIHDPVSMYEDETMASLKEKLVRAEEVNTTMSLDTIWVLNFEGH